VLARAQLRWLVGSCSKLLAAMLQACMFLLAFVTALSPQWRMASAQVVTAAIPTWAFRHHGRSCKGLSADVGDVPNNMSQHGEDQFLLKHFLGDQVCGFYVELGAFNGKLFSNTWYMRHKLGWRGMLIEASPSEAQALAVNRPDDITIHAAVCDDTRVVHWIEQPVVGGIYEFMAEGFKQQFHPNAKIDSMKEITCLPLRALFRMFGVSHVDALFVDVEGAELQVLQTVDFKRTHVSVVVVEADNHSPTKDADVRALMKHHGFVLFRQGPPNDYFYHPSFVTPLVSL
jgi:FkbM family methyltransferase